MEELDITELLNMVGKKNTSPSRVEEARKILESLNITEKDIEDAVAWARSFETGKEL